MPFAKFLFCLVLIASVNTAIAWYNNLPQDAGPDVPSGKLRSLSFAPYRDGFSPDTQTFPLPEHVEEDVALLADKTFSIRTYSVRGGMQPTPEFARKYGVDMILGGWLGNGHPENRIEIQTLIQTANANPDVVKRVIVGNEVLLRKDMDIDTLIRYIRQVKQAIKQPVTYADVWSSYLQYPQLFAEVDFITIHILPYWEDEPVPIDHAARHVEKIIEKIESKALEMGQQHKAILIGESGWPAFGRQRSAAEPSVVNEARFIRELIQVANRHGYDYNIVEAFNQPWKSEHEGVVGANWGLLTINREPVFPLTGPVLENSHWKQHLVWASVLFLLAAALFFKDLIAVPILPMLLFLATAQLFSTTLVDGAQFLWYTSYDDWQRLYTLILVLLNGALAWLLLRRGTVIFNNRSDTPFLTKTLTLGYLIFMLLAVQNTYALAISGRYLSFPNQQFAIPVIGIAALFVWQIIEAKQLNCRMLSIESLLGGSDFKPLIRFSAWLLVLGVPALIAGESYGFLSAHDFIEAHPQLSEGLPVALAYTLKNTQLVTWLLFVLMLSIPSLQFEQATDNRQRNK